MFLNCRHKENIATVTWKIEQQSSVVISFPSRFVLEVKNMVSAGLKTDSEWR